MTTQFLYVLLYKDNNFTSTTNFIINVLLKKYFLLCYVNFRDHRQLIIINYIEIVKFSLYRNFVIVRGNSYKIILLVISVLKHIHKHTLPFNKYSIMKKMRTCSFYVWRKKMVGYLTYFKFGLSVSFSIYQNIVESNDKDQTK